jgi:glycosyltransferase involved in cell wall biosynthesis
LIYIIDRIGVQSGMHYYNASFLKELLKIDEEVEIISNYKNESTTFPILFNFYLGSFFRKISLLLKSYFNLVKCLLKSKESKIILLFYGEWHDLLFLIVCRFAKKKVILDIHEVIGLEYVNNKVLLRLIPIVVNNLSSAAICHSKRSKKLLESNNYNKEIFSVPHFKYDFSMLDKGIVSNDVKLAFNKKRINILFFGQIRLSKGLDVLLKALNLLDDAILEKINIIIAGIDKENIISNFGLNPALSLTVINRYIKDNELFYLYSNTDYAILPYKEISQSGVVEAALYFKKQLILSNLAYFKKILSSYPSFGFSFKSENPNDLKELITRLVHLPLQTYNQKDFEQYSSQQEVDLFLLQFKEYLIENEDSNTRN